MAATTTRVPEPVGRDACLHAGGAGRLHDAELLALVLEPDAGPGRPVGGEGASAAEAVAGRLLACFGHLSALARSEAPEVRALAGLSGAAAGRLAAAFELGRRALAPPWPKEEPFSDPEDVWAHYRVTLAPLDREVFLAVGLDVRCRRVCEIQVADGGLSSCGVRPRDVFLPMLRRAAHSLLLVHNHPSGDPTPSREDRRLTVRLATCGSFLGLEVVDHVIVAQSGYHSMAEEGALQVGGGQS